MILGFWKNFKIAPEAFSAVSSLPDGTSFRSGEVDRRSLRIAFTPSSAAVGYGKMAAIGSVPGLSKPGPARTRKPHKSKAAFVAAAGKADEE
jgi:hypothetical protein